MLAAPKLYGSYWCSFAVVFICSTLVWSMFYLFTLPFIYNANQTSLWLVLGVCVCVSETHSLTVYENMNISIRIRRAWEWKQLNVSTNETIIYVRQNKCNSEKDVLNNQMNGWNVCLCVYVCVLERERERERERENIKKRERENIYYCQIVGLSCWWFSDDSNCKAKQANTPPQPTLRQPMLINCHWPSGQFTKHHAQVLYNIHIHSNITVACYTVPFRLAHNLG